MAVAFANTQLLVAPCSLPPVSRPAVHGRTFLHRTLFHQEAKTSVQYKTACGAHGVSLLASAALMSAMHFFHIHRNTQS